MDEQTAAALNKRATELSTTVEELRLAADAVWRRTDRQERLLKYTITTLVLDILISIAVIWGFHTLHLQSDRLQVQSDKLSASVAQEDNDRNGALCPLFALILGNYNPNSRPPDARPSYDDAFAQMRTIYKNLACTTPIVPPPGK